MNLLDKKELISIRPLRDGDINLVYATWLKGLRHGNDWFERIDPDVFFEKYRAIIERLLAKSDARVACLQEDHDTILGYSIFQGPVLHWIFVKPAWRKIGLARDLMPKDISTVTHITKVGAAIKPDGISFNPFLL